MSSSFDVTQELQGFAGTAPLFPLPNAAFFPHILLPLHVFEPRYRRMVFDALDSNRLIAMAQLKHGWETAGAEQPPLIFETVCLGRISVEEQTPDGRYYVVLQGLSRARVVAEEQNYLPYRVGRLELCRDRYPVEPVIDRENRKRELLESFCRLFPVKDLNQIYYQVLDADVPLGVLCDVLTYAMKLEASAIQKILSELNVDFRSDLVLELIRELSRQQQYRRTHRGFPPEFSLN